MNFSIEAYASALAGTGRKVIRSRNKLLSQCLQHSEKHPSMQVFSDGWCNCQAGCGRFHISKYFDEFKDTDWKPEKNYSTQKDMATPAPVKKTNKEKASEYQRYELLQEWENMELIPRDHVFKGIKLEVLDELGWRWTDGLHGMAAGYFIPYWTDRKKNSIPFAQVRHLSGTRRFTFLPGAMPTVYGKWNLYPGEKIFIVEGCSDAAVLESVGVPAIAMPSASSGSLLEGLAKYCITKNIKIIYAGDNDEAGDKLLEHLDEVAPYRVCQPPKKYKDWGEYYEGSGEEKVHARVFKEYMQKQTAPNLQLAKDTFTI